MKIDTKALDNIYKKLDQKKAVYAKEVKKLNSIDGNIEKVKIQEQSKFMPIK